jgi:hypothetical protein
LIDSYDANGKPGILALVVSAASVVARVDVWALASVEWGSLYRFSLINCPNSLFSFNNKNNMSFASYRTKKSYTISRDSTSAAICVIKGVQGAV